MKVTKKAINKALPSVRFFNKAYVPFGFSGVIPENASTMASVVFRVDENGDVIERDYGVGDGYLPEDYHMEGFCVDVADTIERWMWGDMSRSEVVDKIQKLFKELEAEE